MALTALSRRRDGQQPAEPKRRRDRRAHQEHREQSLDGLTVADLHYLRLHGAKIPGNALTGAALDVTSNNAMDVRRLVQPWQARSMSYFDLTPEVKFGARFNGNLLRRVRLFPALLDDATGEPEEETSGPIFDAFQRIKDRNGGMAELQGSYGTLKFLIGETYLTVSPDKDRNEVWECLSPNELRVQPGGIATRFRAPMLAADQYQIEEIKTDYLIGNDPTTIAEWSEDGKPLGPQFVEGGPDIIVVYRLWRPHPAYTWLADSNMMASLDLLEELVLSTYSVRAQLKSRLYQTGVLAVPQEMGFPSLGNNPDEDPNSDNFQERLTTAIMTAIGDPGSAAAQSPLVMEVAGEFLKDLKYIRFNDNQGELAEISQRAEMIERFGVGAELPPELFKSQADLNHWTGWLIDEQTWKSYGHPAALEMASDINAAYLQPAMMDEEGVDWTKVCIGIDPTAVINHPNRGADAKSLYEARCISKVVYLEALGYNENDLPPEDELNEMIGVAIRDGSYARYGIPAVRANIEPNAGDIESAQGGAATTVNNPTTGSENEPGPPPGGPGPNDTSGGSAVTAAGDDRSLRLLALAEAGVRRGRELAGSRLRSMSGKRGARCEECLKTIAGVPNWDVAHTLGELQVVAMSGPATAALVDGTGHWLAAMLEEAGISKQWAVELGALVEQHTAGTLYSPVAGEFPAGFLRLLARVDMPLERT